MRHPSIRVPVSFSVSLSFVGSFESLWFVVTARLLPAGSARRPPRVSRSAGVHDKHEVEELIGSVMMEGCVATTNMSDALQQ